MTASGAGDAGLPDAGSKLRLVLDYLPCEACLAQPVHDQDLLCTICARLDRQVAVSVETRTTVLVERPSPPEAPVVIPPAPAALSAPEPQAALPRELVVRFADDAREADGGTLEVLVEPVPPLPALPALAPVPAPAPIPLVAAAPEPAPEPEPEPEEPEFDDLFSFTPARDEFFDYRKPAAAPAPPPPAPAAEPAPEPAPAAPPEDDFVFRPPPVEEAPREAEPELAPEVEEPVPREEVPVEPAEPEPEPWAPPPDLFPDDEPAPREEAVVEEEIVEMEVVPDDEEVVEMELVEDEPAPALAPEPEPAPAIAPAPEPAPADEEVLEMEIVEDEPAPEPPAAGGSGDLYRLRGFDAASGAALAQLRITEISHLAGHDAGELAQRSGLPFERVLAWVQVADLVHEVGVPLDAASALVAAGVAGPRGLAEADPDEVADRVSAFGGYALTAREVRRWKRRA